MWWGPGKNQGGARPAQGTWPVGVLPELGASPGPLASCLQEAASPSAACVASSPAVPLAQAQVCLVPGSWVLLAVEWASPPLLPAQQGPPPLKYPPVGRSFREAALRASRLSLSEQLLPELLGPSPSLCHPLLLPTWPWPWRVVSCLSGWGRGSDTEWQCRQQPYCFIAFGPSELLKMWHLGSLCLIFLFD